ncbi:MAG TPA: methyl-accepting chemotaxis protein [Vicinamibacterales bacterium]
MKFPKISLKIGAKLGVMSGLGVVLVLCMIGGFLYSGNKIDRIISRAIQEQALALDFAEVMSNVRAAQINVKDIRLAINADEVTRHVGLLDLRIGATSKLFGKIEAEATDQDDRERAEKIKGLFTDYIGSGQQLAKLKRQVLELGASQLDQKDSLEEKLNDLVNNRSAITANQMVQLTEQGVASSRSDAMQAADSAKQEMQQAEYLNVGIGGFVALILLGAAIFGVVSIARPLARLVPELKKLADGDFNVTVPGIGRKDEVGQIAEAAEMVADRVGSTIVDIKTSASEVTNASAEISTSTTDLSQRTEEQAASLEETSASMEEMTATVKKNAENAKQASELANSTREVADRGGAVVAKTVEAMAKIEESSRKISDIIIVIDEIARQTNLLALNAAVEAARAGDAGRGFAVVASEVRSLAQRSSQAAKDIKDLITSSTGQVKDGVELVNRAGQSLHEIVESIKKVTTVVTEIANASMEQSTGIEQINRALTQMDEMTQQNSALVEENAATAKTLEQQAMSMDERVAVFKVRGDAAETAEPAPVAHERPATAKPISVPQAAAPKRSGPAQKRANGAAKMNGSAHGGPVGRMQAGLAVALKEDVDWKEF